jgi:hypothetical protein
MRSTLIYRDPNTVEKIDFSKKKRKEVPKSTVPEINNNPLGIILERKESTNETTSKESKSKSSKKKKDTESSSSIDKDSKKSEKKSAKKTSKKEEESSQLPTLSIDNVPVYQKKTFEEGLEYNKQEHNDNVRMINIGIAIVEKKTKLDETENIDCLKYKLIYLTVGERIIKNNDLMKEVEEMSVTHMLMNRDDKMMTVVTFGIRTVANPISKQFLLFEIDNQDNYLDSMIDCQINGSFLKKKIAKTKLSFLSLFNHVTKRKINIKGWKSYLIAQNGIVACDELLQVY